MIQKRNGRRGSVFSTRLTDDERARLESLQRVAAGPRSLGPWLVWNALRPGQVVPPQRAESADTQVELEQVVPTRAGSTRAQVVPAQVAPLILDLCGGSGSWARPYVDAGYRVLRVTLPEHDVRTWTPPDEPVHGVLCAPPCEQFSLARNGHPKPRDFVTGMATVNACMRIVAQVRPVWWALENPVGMLSKFLGTPRDVWEPCDFGDPWTKRTAIWGDYVIPTRGPFVLPLGGGPICRVCNPTKRATSWCNNRAHRAITPAGFARAFFEANP